tara:strand:- start:487 stop:792 length:306 start_codon:yes stop_codon:yes gene_type:complete
MYTIYITYNDKLIKDINQFNKTADSLKSLYGKAITFETNSDVMFQIKFNDKLIYCLEDSFDSNLLIDRSLLSKINNYIENAIKIHNSKDISPIDDIWIEDF